VFEQAAHVEQLLREINPVVPKANPVTDEPDTDVEEPAAGEPDDKE
jgi:hypothetical protein